MLIGEITGRTELEHMVHYVYSRPDWLRTIICDSAEIISVREDDSQEGCTVSHSQVRPLIKLIHAVIVYLHPHRPLTTLRCHRDRVSMHRINKRPKTVSSAEAAVAIKEPWELLPDDEDMY